MRIKMETLVKLVSVAGLWMAGACQNWSLVLENILLWLGFGFTDRL
jgi:hypothetical protein